MFVVARQRDTVAVEPTDQHKPPEEAIEAAVNAKYANKVLPHVGLCICFFNLENSSDAIVTYGDVIFQLLVFRPLPNEVFIAKVQSTSETTGVQMTVGFFNDIIIPPALLPFGATYDSQRDEFYWVPELEEGQNPSTAPFDSRLYIQAGDQMRVRQHAEHFNTAGLTRAPKASQPGVPAPIPSTAPSPYTIECSIQHDGLGNIAWWQNTE